MRICSLHPARIEKLLAGLPFLPAVSLFEDFKKWIILPNRTGPAEPRGVLHVDQQVHRRNWSGYSAGAGGGAAKFNFCQQ